VNVCHIIYLENESLQLLNLGRVIILFSKKKKGHSRPSHFAPSSFTL